MGKWQAYRGHGGVCFNSPHLHPKGTHPDCEKPARDGGFFILPVALGFSHALETIDFCPNACNFRLR